MVVGAKGGCARDHIDPALPKFEKMPQMWIGGGFEASEKNRQRTL
jgi:hypothetical protein